MSERVFNIAVNFKAVENVTAVLNGMEDRLNITHNILKNTGDAMQRMGEKAKKMAQVASVAIAGLGVGVGFFAKQVVEAGSQYQSFMTTLSTTEGSMAGAEKAMKFIDQFASTTPYQLNEVTDAYIRLKANGIDAMNGSLKAAGDAASVFQKPISSAVEALGDAIRGENERLKEFGVNARTKGDMIYYHYSYNGKKMVKAANKNNALMIEAVLTGIWNERFAGQMQKQSLSYKGAISNLQDTYGRFMRRIANNGFMKLITADLNKLVKWLSKPEIQAKLEKYADVIGKFMGDVYKEIRTFVTKEGPNLLKTLKNFKKFIDEHGGVKKWLAFLAGATAGAIVLNVGLSLTLATVGALVTAFAPLIAIVAAAFFTKSLISFGTEIVKVKSLGEGLGVTLKFLAQPLTQALNIVKFLGRGFLGIISRLGGVVMWVGRFVVGFAVANPVVAGIIIGVTVLVGLGMLLYNKWKPFRDLINGIGAKIKELAMKVPFIADMINGKKKPPASPIKRALGGSVNAHEWYQVNENGSPEYFSPATNGRILSHADAKSSFGGLKGLPSMGGGGIKHQLHIHISSDGTPKVVEQHNSGQPVNVKLNLSGMGLLR